MSPEQARGLETDARSDIFSLGVVLYEMVSARRPFTGVTPADVVAALLGEEPKPIEDAPAELQALISRMLAKDCSARYQTADELQRALKRLKRDLAPEDDFSTREFGGLSLLARRFIRSGDYKTAAITTGPAHATSVELDYLSPATSAQLGQILYRARRYDQAITVLKKTLDLEPNFAAARYYLGLCYLMQGKKDDAIAELQKGRNNSPDNPVFIAGLGRAYGETGRRDQARSCLAELNEVAKRRYIPPFNRANIHAGLGEFDLS